MWLERLNNLPLFLEPWLRHRGGRYWKHGSCARNTAPSMCPVYAVGGWTNSYPMQSRACSRT